MERQIPFLPQGATVTVTSSPRRGLDPTLLLCERLAGRGFRAVPHVSARLVDGRGHLDAIVRRLQDAGISEIFVVGGDSPQPTGPFESALSLLRALGETGHRFERVGVAGYPERHPLVDDASLTRSLREKEAFASYVVTQICYDPRAIVAWVDRVRGEGISLPVFIGMPGAVNRVKLLEMSLRVGVGASIAYLRKHGGLVGRLVRRGGYRPDAFLANLSPLLEEEAGNVVGFHINTFNQVESTERWRQGHLARFGVAELPAS
jgi:methylenetetrahydrofolate reductase (NADPH)